MIETKRADRIAAQDVNGWYDRQTVIHTNPKGLPPVLTGDWATDRAVMRSGGFCCTADLAAAIRRGDHPPIR